MGVYVYTIRRRFINIRVGTEIVRAALVKYAYKDRGLTVRGIDDYWIRRRNMMIGRAEHAWIGHDMPDYFVIGDDFENGCVVKKGWTKGCVSAVDTPGFPGEYVGTLAKDGRGKYHALERVKS